MNTKQKWRTAALLAAIATTGCYKATFVAERDAMARQTTHEQWTEHYLFGLVGKEDHDVREWCRDGAAMVRTGGNVATVAVTVLTLGIYAPRKVYVTRNDEPAAGAVVAEVSR